MPAQLPRLNVITQRRKLVLNTSLVNNQPKNPASVFGGGMVNRIAKTPAGCGCGGAR